MMNSNDDLTIAARVKGWEIFAPDWDYLRQYSTLQLGSLCALSVGLHPAFADPSWVFNVAMPHFSGTDTDALHPLEDAAEGEKRAALLDDFLRRVQIAAAELVPRGTLPIADGAADGERTVVRVADFVAWATALPAPWELPEEMKRMGPYPEAEEGLQDGGKPLTPRAETTYLNIIGGLLALMLGKSPAGKAQSVFNNQAAIISALLAHHADKPGIAQRTLEEKFAAANRSLTAT